MTKNKKENNIDSLEIFLNKWIFSFVSFEGVKSVLELCCGEGEKSGAIHKGTGSDSEFFLLDKSQKKLDVVKRKLGEKNRVYICQELDELLNEKLICEKKFDVIFCSNGLFFAQDYQTLMKSMKFLLEDDGKIIVVGPYGRNNQELFGLLEDNGMQIAESVRDASESFMEEIVLPFMIANFNHVDIHTTEYVQSWRDAESVMKYLETQSFYDRTGADDLKIAIDERIAHQKKFFNGKHLMLLQISEKNKGLV